METSVREASNHDVLIMGTAQDAVKAKYATVVAGYYVDPYIGAFATNPSNTIAPVQVIIKRGTFARTACIFKAVTLFLRQNSAAQVLVLGSGKDSLFFRILDELEAMNRGSDASLRWLEVDYDAVLREKLSAIQTNPRVFGATVIGSANNDLYELRPSSSTTTSTRSWSAKTVCTLIAHDLQYNPETLVNDKLLQQASMDPTIPTLIVLECVQMYLPVDAVIRLLKPLTSTIQDCSLVSYEPILGIESPSNSFGRMMEENLTKAGIVRPDSCLLQTRTISQTLSRLQTMGFVRATACDMYAAYETVLSVEQRRTAQTCEFLDEIEEFMLIMRHYCLVVACNNIDSVSGCVMSEIANHGGKPSAMGFVAGRCEKL